VRQNLVARNRMAGFSAALQHLMQFPGVVGNDGIGEEGQRAADDDFFVPSTPAIDANRTRVNDALELVDRFPADQYSVDAAPKGRLAGIVAQVYRIPPLPPLRTRAMEPCVASG